MQTVRQQLEEALGHCKATLERIPRNHFTSRHQASVRCADRALDRARAEPEQK